MDLRFVHIPACVALTLYRDYTGLLLGPYGPLLPVHTTQHVTLCLGRLKSRLGCVWVGS